MRTPTDPASETPLEGLEGHFDEFLRTRVSEIQEIKEAIDLGDYQLIMKFAHKWKGFAAPYGFGLLGELALDLELSAERSDGDACQLLLDEVETYLGTKYKKQDDL